MTSLVHSINSSTIRLKDLYKTKKYFQEEYLGDSDYKIWIISCLVTEIKNLENEVYFLYKDDVFEKYRSNNRSSI